MPTLWRLLCGGYSVMASLGGCFGCLLCGGYSVVATLGGYSVGLLWVATLWWLLCGSTLWWLLCGGYSAVSTLRQY